MEEQKIKSTDNARYFQCRILFQHTIWYAIIHKYFHIKKPSRAEIFNVHLMKKMPFLKEKKQVVFPCAMIIGDRNVLMKVAAANY